MKYDLLMLHNEKDEDIMKLMSKQLSKSVKCITMKNIVQSEQSEHFDLYNAMLESAR